MGKIYCIVGRSSTGKDTIFKHLINDKDLNLNTIVPYTTRPIRDGEKEGVEYHFTDTLTLEQLKKEHKVIEYRAYNTIHGIWYYFTVKDNQIDLKNNNYLVIGTLESYIMTKQYFGADVVIPIYIDLDDGECLTRALNREKKQKEPKYEEMCRRFLADSKDFSEQKLKDAGIDKVFYNDNLDVCLREITDYISSLDKRG